MSAKEFVRKFGWSIAIESVDHAVNAYDGIGDSLYCMSDGYASIIHPSYLSGDECVASDLKTLIDAYELVQTGLQELKDKMFSNEKTIDDVKQWVLTVNESLLTPKGIELKQAIKLVGSVDE